MTDTEQKLAILYVVKVKIQTDLDRQHYYNGLCAYLSSASIELDRSWYIATYGDYTTTTALRLYTPELYKRRPNIFYDDNYWFSRTKAGLKARLKRVNETIDELKS